MWSVLRAVLVGLLVTQRPLPVPTARLWFVDLTSMVLSNMSSMSM
jgi:hypothetical protein